MKIGLATQMKYNFDGVEQVLNIIIFSYSLNGSFSITSKM